MERTMRNRNNRGPVPEHCRVKVVSVQNADPLSDYPANVNYAAGLSYTIMAQTPTGMVGPFVGAIPSLPRWPSPWLVEAFPVGAILPAGVMDGVIYIDAREERWAAPCGFSPGSPPIGEPTTPRILHAPPPGPIGL